MSVSALPLFASASVADLSRDRELLTRLASELALRAGRFGCTVSDLRIAAENRGILTGEESGARMKSLNLGAIMREAGLVASDRFRRSDVRRAHRNLGVVWTVREFANVSVAADAFSGGEP